MRIAIVTSWFADKMGYAENILPKALAKAGAEVHVISSNLQPDLPNYKEAYEPYLGPRLQPTGEWEINGFRLTRLPHGRQDHRVWIKGLHSHLKSVKPDVVQCQMLPAWCTYQTVAAKYRLHFPLFLEEHIHRSVFNVRPIWGTFRLFAYRNVVGRTVSHAMERCYATADDVLEVAVELGLDRRKLQVVPLGVDTDVFRRPASTQELNSIGELRSKLGFDRNDIVCIYSGRFSEDKNPQCLADAIHRLQEAGLPFRGLFIGSGSTKEINAIAQRRGCIVHPFVNYNELPLFYQSADIAVWPKQESISQLDAVACGLPLVISDRVSVKERIEGNGFLYNQDDPSNLATVLSNLDNADLRRKLGDAGADKVWAKYSWDRIAKDRLIDFEQSVNMRSTKEGHSRSSV